MFEYLPNSRLILTTQSTTPVEDPITGAVTFASNVSITIEVSLEESENLNNSVDVLPGRYSTGRILGVTARPDK